MNRGRKHLIHGVVCGSGPRCSGLSNSTEGLSLQCARRANALSLTSRRGIRDRNDTWQSARQKNQPANRGITACPPHPTPNRWLSLFPRESQAACDARHRPPHKQIGQNRERSSRDDRLAGIHKAQHCNLIARIQNQRQQEYLADALPAVPDDFLAM